MGPAGLLHRGADYTKGEGGKGTLVRRKWWPHTTWCVPRAARCGEYQAWRGVIRGRRTEGSRSVKSRFEAQSGSHGVPQVCARAGRAWRSVRLRGARDRVTPTHVMGTAAQRSSAICGDAVCALERLTSCPPMPVENRDEPRSVSDELVQFAATATAAAAQQYQQSVCTTSARYGYIFQGVAQIVPCGRLVLVTVAPGLLGKLALRRAPHPCHSPRCLWRYGPSRQHYPRSQLLRLSFRSLSGSC